MESVADETRGNEKVKDNRMDRDRFLFIRFFNELRIFITFFFQESISLLKITT